MNQQDLQAFLEEADAALKSGRSIEVIQALSRLHKPSIPRKYRAPLGRLCRRVGDINNGLKILSPVAHPAKAPDPSPIESAEYAALLNLSGSTSEALKTLQNSQLKDLPETYLFQAFCQVRVWNYYEAIPLLKKYIECPIGDYERLIGQVNLAAALVFKGEFGEALSLLEDLIKTCQSSSYFRLAGNCLEMKSQIFISQGRYSDAETTLQSANTYLGGDATTDHFLIRKWKAILQALRGEGLEGLEALQALRAEARSVGNWETVRDCDLHELKVQFNSEKFAYLYFGTPFEPYREKILKYLGKIPPEDTYILGDSKNMIDPKEESTTSRRLLLALSRDFYRPESLGSLFSTLFPGEHFDIFSSPNRLHQLLHRARKSWEGRGIEVRVHRETFRLELAPHLGLRIQLDSKPYQHGDDSIAKLRKTFPQGGFSRSQATKILGCSSATFKRLMTRAILKGEAERYGHGAATTYDWAI